MIGRVHYILSLIKFPRPNVSNDRLGPFHFIPFLLPDGSDYQGRGNVEYIQSNTSQSNTSRSLFHTEKRLAVEKMLQAKIITHDEYNLMLDNIVALESGSGSVAQAPPVPRPSTSVAPPAGIPSSLPSGLSGEPGTGTHGVAGSGRQPSPRVVIVEGAGASRQTEEKNIESEIGSVTADFKELHDFITEVYYYCTL